MLPANTEMMSHKLKFLRMSGQVRRYHTWPQLKDQNLAAHSHGVAVLVCYLHPEASANLIRAALYHDLSEFVTGDLPSTAKWAYPELKQAAHDASADVEEKVGLRMVLSYFEQRLLLWCDYAELVLYSLHEWKMGNQFGRVPAERVLSRLREMEAPNMEADELLTQMWATYDHFVEGNFHYTGDLV